MPRGIRLLAKQTNSRFVPRGFTAQQVSAGYRLAGCRLHRPRAEPSPLRPLHVDGGADQQAGGGGELVQVQLPNPRLTVAHRPAAHGGRELLVHRGLHDAGEDFDDADDADEEEGQEAATELLAQEELDGQDEGEEQTLEAGGHNTSWVRLFICLTTYCIYCGRKSYLCHTAHLI